MTVPSDRRCATDGCDARHFAKGYCQSCYNKGRRRGAFGPPSYVKRTDGLCPRCGVSPRAVDASYCAPCRSDHRREMEQRNLLAGLPRRTKRPHKPELRRNVALRARYKMTPEAFAAILESQGGKCAICREVSDKWHIDHDHTCCPPRKTCGACTRGLLCPSCNLGMGYFRDDVMTMSRAIGYLVIHSGRTQPLAEVQHPNYVQLDRMLGRTE